MLEPTSHLRSNEALHRSSGFLLLSVPLQAIFLSVLIHALWGGNPIAAIIGLEVFPPAWSAFIRFLFGIATIVAWCLYRRHRIWLKSHEWQPVLWIGLTFTLQIWLMNVGFNNTSGINSAILISANPLFAAFFSHFLSRGDRLNAIRSAGLFIAFFGVCLTLVQKNPTTGGIATFGNFGDWMCIISACLLGYRLIVSANVMRRVDPFRLAIWQMVLSLPLFAALGFSTETINWSAMSFTIAAALAYQGIVVAGLGFMVSLWLISRYQPSIMAGFGFLSPVVGVLLSVTMLGESPTALLLSGVVLVAIGMVLITLKVGDSS